MWELEYKSWAMKNWCFWTVVLETFESPLDYKEIQLVHPKGDQSWVFIARTDVEAEIPILWPLERRADSFEKALMLGRIEGRRGREWQRMRRLDGITDSMDMSKLWELVMGLQRVKHDWATELKWTDNLHICFCLEAKAVSYSLWFHGAKAHQAPLSMGFLRQEF